MSVTLIQLPNKTKDYLYIFLFSRSLLGDYIYSIMVENDAIGDLQHCLQVVSCGRS